MQDNTGNANRISINRFRLVQLSVSKRVCLFVCSVVCLKVQLSVSKCVVDSRLINRFQACQPSHFTEE